MLKQPLDCTASSTPLEVTSAHTFEMSAIEKHGEMF
jgi:hypothetical protein